MADRGVIFCGSSVRALVDGRKTQTRRLLSPSNLRVWTGGLDHGGGYVRPDAAMMQAALNNARNFRTIEGRLNWVTDPAPHQTGAVMAQWLGRLCYASGDRLWVRENHFVVNDGHGADYLVRYDADRAEHWCMDRTGCWAGSPSPAKRSSCFLPRWASRLTLTVTDVRVQRLQEISETDAIAEGCFKGKTTGRIFENQAAMRLGADEWAQARDWYADRWEMLHGAKSWDANPWVVALTFTVHAHNIDALAPAQCREASADAR